MAQENFVTTAPQIAEDRTTNNRKAKEHNWKTLSERIRALERKKSEQNQ